MTFGQIIKTLRRNADMTQEQLAAVLSISGQAVSRWENDAAMPDISLLPVLANLFNVTTDHLLGVDISHKEEKIKAYILRAEEAGKIGHKQAAADIIRAGLKEYPGSYALLYQLQYHLYCRAGQLSAAEREAVIDEVIALGEKLLHECTENELRHGAVRWLCFCYAERGETEKAERLAKTMPEPWLSKEYLLSVVYRGDKQYTVCTRKGDRKTVSFSCF